MLTAGVDLGSRSSKAVILLDGQVISTAIIDTEARAGQASQEVLTLALRHIQRNQAELDKIVATGYGRISAPFANKIITEITCHAKGAYQLNPLVKTIIDIGGQDSKVIRIGEKGLVDDFVMNDRCAAGTGRFIEVMAKILQIDLVNFGENYFRAAASCQISNTCTVFAESEVVGLIAAGHKSEDIAKGLMQAIAGRVGSMVRRLGVMPEVVFSGGVAKNSGVRQALIDELGVNIAQVENFDPQLIGALGAAVLAQNL